jgi:hypothetical protein
MDFNKIFEITSKLDAPLQPIEDGEAIRCSNDPLLERQLQETPVASSKEILVNLGKIGIIDFGRKMKKV